MKEKLNEVRVLVKGIKKVESEKKNELENTRRNYKKTVKQVAATLGISTVILFSFLGLRPNKTVPSADIPTYQEDDQQNGNGSKDELDKDDNNTTPEKEDNGQSRKYNPSAGIKEEEKLTHDTTVEDTLHSESDSTKVEGSESYQAEIEDNAKEEETTQKAVEKAKEENITITHGDVKDEKGNTTDDKITATQGHTSDTKVDLNYEEEDRTNSKKIDIQNSTNATRSEETKTYVIKEEIYSTQSDKLDELMNKTQKQIDDDDYQR